MASRGKSGQGDNGGRRGKELDEKSMASECEVLFGVIGLIFMRFVVESLPSLPSPAVEQVYRQASQLERGKKRGKVVDDRSMAWGVRSYLG